MNAARRGSLVILLAFSCSQAQADSDLSLLKSVTPETPVAGEPVEFNIAVGNAGPDPASDIHVTELLPEGLAIPTGMAAFVSQGTYDAATGNWALGDLAMGANAVMTLPAQVSVDPQPPCLVNEAAIETNPSDPGRTRETSSAAVRNGVDRCVDLEIPDSLFIVPQPFCSDETTARLSFVLRNHGPHEARNVVVVEAQSPARIPGLRFTTANCGPDALRCAARQPRAGRHSPAGSRIEFVSQRYDLLGGAHHRGDDQRYGLRSREQRSGQAGTGTAHGDPALRPPGRLVWRGMFHRHGRVGRAVGRQCANPAALPRSCSHEQRARPRVRALVLPRVTAACRLHREEPRAPRGHAGGADAAG